MYKFVFRGAAAVFVAVACVTFMQGHAVGSFGYALMAAGLVAASRVSRKQKSKEVEPTDDDVVQFGWGLHGESVRPVSERDGHRV